MNTVLFRPILDALIFIAIIQGWWFFALPLGLLGAWKCSGFAEIVIAGIMYDALFGFMPGTGLWGSVGTISSAVLLMGVVFLKKVARK